MEHLVNVTYTAGGGAGGTPRESRVAVMVAPGHHPEVEAANLVAGRIKQQYPGAHAMVIAARYIE